MTQRMVHGQVCLKVCHIAKHSWGQLRTVHGQTVLPRLEASHKTNLRVQPAIEPAVSQAASQAGSHSAAHSCHSSHSCHSCHSSHSCRRRHSGEVAAVLMAEAWGHLDRQNRMGAKGWKRAYQQSHLL